MRIVQLLVSVALLGLATSSFAGEERRGALFPPFKKREAPAASPAPAPPPAPTNSSSSTTVTGAAPSAEVVKTTAMVGPDGVWQWVDRLQGDATVPTQVQAAQVQGVEEKTEEQIAERGLVEDLSGSPVPTLLYTDPARALEVDPLFLDQLNVKEFDIPVETNELVVKWMRYFTGDGRQYYERWLARSTRFQPMMREKLEAAGLPQDLVFLSMIESGYNPNAYSHSDAAGLWQFIPSTGKVYDLRIDWWVDERRDPAQSADAAIEFLGELYKMFGDWRLAWASYNGGPGRVKRSVEKAGTKDFWALVETDYLHPETENYVPKIMAAAIIGKHPERYGFTGIKFQDALVYDVAHVDGSVELTVLAKCAGVSLEALQELNPALRRYATPPEGYDLRLPVGAKPSFVAALDKVPASERLSIVKHTVRRGETLSVIAGKYGTTVEAISAANDVRNVNKIEVGTSLVIPRSADAVPPPSGSTTLASVSSSASKSSGAARTSTRTAPPPPKKEVVHTVSRGETLSALATRYGTTVSALKSTNGLTSNTIEVGQKLKVPGEGTAAAAAPTFHTVSRGETLTTIGKQYDVDPSQLQTWNGVDDPSHIEVGQKLCVSGPAPLHQTWTSYEVRVGDSLSKIATRNRCTVEELRAWNGLGKSSVIQPGQKLKIQRTST